MSYTLPLPPYLKGKNISAQTIITQTISNTGVLTAATTYDMKALGIIDTWEYTGNAPGMDVHPTDGTFANYILAGVEDFEFKVGEIERQGAPSVLLAGYFTSNFFRFECDLSDDTGVAGYKFAIMVTRAGGTITKGMVEDKNGVIATFKPCATPPYYGTGTPPF